MQKGSCTAQSPFIALPLAISSKVRGSAKATGGEERKRASETCTRPLIELRLSSSKSQEFLQGNVYPPLCIASFCISRSDFKSSFRYRWIIGCEPESERSFSEAAGRVQQYNGALISSLCCRREKNPDAFPLYSFYFFHWPPKLQGFHCSPSLVACHHWESSS